MVSTSSVSCKFLVSCQELPSLTIDDSHCGVREPVIQFESISDQPSHRRQKTDTLQRTPLSPLTPSAVPKQRMAVPQSSYTGTALADGVRRSPIGEFGDLIVFYYALIASRHSIVGR